jgi:hypothetical protein
MTEARSRRKTGNGPTKMRGVRVESDIWEPAKAKAAAMGTDLSAVVRAALERFTAPVDPVSAAVVELVDALAYAGTLRAECNRMRWSDAAKADAVDALCEDAHVRVGQAAYLLGEQLGDDDPGRRLLDVIRDARERAATAAREARPVNAKKAANYGPGPVVVARLLGASGPAAGIPSGSDAECGEGGNTHAGDDAGHRTE